jgi:hypothetical protein
VVTGIKIMEDSAGPGSVTLIVPGDWTAGSFSA